MEFSGTCQSTRKRNQEKKALETTEKRQRAKWNIEEKNAEYPLKRAKTSNDQEGSSNYSLRRRIDQKVDMNAKSCSNDSDVSGLTLSSLDNLDPISKDPSSKKNREVANMPLSSKDKDGGPDVVVGRVTRASRKTGTESFQLEGVGSAVTGDKDACSKIKRSGKRMPNTENLMLSLDDKDLESGASLISSTKERCSNSNINTECLRDSDGSSLVTDSSSSNVSRNLIQPLNGWKKSSSARNSRNREDLNDVPEKPNSVFSGNNMLLNLPSKLSMFSEAPRNTVEKKYGVDSGKPVATRLCQPGSGNLLHLLSQNMFGMRTGLNKKKVVVKALSSGISDFRLVRTASPFDRRCTAMAWHPFNPNVVLVGSKGGDLMLMDLENGNRDIFMQGCGLGGVIQAIKFLPETTSALRVLTASMDGTVVLRDLATQSTVTTFIDTSHVTHSVFSDFWYCSCDVGPRCNVVVSGDSLGNATLQTVDGEKIWSQKLHKNKVNHVEFHRQQEWLLCTASTDQTVCLWDIRMLKNRDSYLEQFKHDRGVNSAYFSNTDGVRLLTTDQHHELRIYQGGTWNLEKKIIHPHRFYQHLTPMKANWHPLEDLVVCGRYPDRTLPGFICEEDRGIDIIDPFSTEIVCRLQDPLAPGIVTLAQFNNIGSTLAATMGYTILIWQKDTSQDEENQVRTIDRPYGFKPDTGASEAPHNVHPKSRAKTNRLPKGTKTKQCD